MSILLLFENVTSGSIEDSLHVFVVYIVLTVVFYLFYSRVYLTLASQQSNAEREKVFAKLEQLWNDPNRPADWTTVSGH